jgi:Tfp pilus assembly protein PilX
MNSSHDRSRGFTLIASLLLLLLMSGIAIGLLMSVNTEGKVGGHDVQNSLAYRSAEGAIEQMTSNLSNTFQNIEAPTAQQICALDSQYPVDPTNSVQYTTYTLTPTSGCTAPLVAQYTQILAGSYQGLYAQVIPVTLNVTAQRNTISQEQVTMMRTVEVALIPVFQFGIFSDGDLSFFSGPSFGFAGRVHTNGDLYLSVGTGSTLTFYDKITAYGNVIRSIEPNGVSTTTASMNQQGTVDILTQSAGCTNPPTPPPGCRAMQQSEGSANAPPPYTNNQNSNWPTISESYYNGWIVDGNNGNPGGTGASSLTLPFAAGTTTSGNPGPGPWPFEIIRRPPPGESINSTLGAARLANEAQIRVLISDIESDLHFSDWNGDSTQDIPLGSPTYGGPSDTVGLTVNGTAGYYFAWANNNSATKDPNGTRPASVDPDYIAPAGNTTGYWPLLVNPQTTSGRTGNSWLLVEAKWNADGKWHGVTKEWLGLGFARGLSVPNAAKGITNNVHPQAILIFQQPADRNGDGIIGTSGTGSCTTVPCSVTTYSPQTGVYSSGSTAGEVEFNNVIGSPFNWLPINFYDTREGEVWDNTPVTEGTGTPNGVMNATELDVRNLQQWLQGKIGTTGTSVDSVAQNGYILYFSDRRGEQYQTGATSLVGEYGFEDNVNIANNGVPNGTLEPFPPGKNMSPEDVNENGTLENYGAVNVGNGFGINTNTNPPNPYSARINLLYRIGRKNQVTGARHVLKLVDGSLGYLPTAPNGSGGFTVAAENPVYIQGDYNSSSADPTWSNPNAGDPAHSAAAVISDAATVLSNNWQDTGFPNAAPPINGSMADSANSNGQSGTTSYYRMAIAAGKGMSAWNPNAGADTGTDGGLHNFIRYLENWSGATLNYKGSLVSLYYSTYGTGTYKCCNLVYQPPTRNYVFDSDFTLPAGLPPGTPMFRDVDNLSYRQTFTPRNGTCF